MKPDDPPPVVPVGPWRSPHVTLPEATPRKKSGWFGGFGDLFFNLFDLVDLVEILFGFFRVVAHLAVVALHAIFHF